MGAEQPKDSLKEMDWKSLGGEGREPGLEPAVKKRLPKKIRQVPDYYFLPRRSLPYSMAFYGSCIAAGVGAGMLLEVWINKKVKVSSNIPPLCRHIFIIFHRLSILERWARKTYSEDGGVIWEFDK